MKTLTSLSLHFDQDRLCILDQRKLPHEESWLVCHSPDDMVDFIKTLAVRGAPLIGVAAALALAHFVEKGASDVEIEQAAKKLIASRPTAVNLSYCVSLQWNTFQATKDRQTIIDLAEHFFEEDAQLSEQIAENGAAEIQPGESILTHCNSGGLVTTGIGTALGAIIRAHQQGKNIHVYVDETRPLLQGGRLTTWELVRLDVPHTLCCDNMAAVLMRDKKIQRVIVGADRIAANGDTANKIGTYGIAALAHLHGIPFHIAAPYTTIDWECPQGSCIEIEQRNPEEVKGFGNLQWSPSASAVFNPAFDVTPYPYITSFITDRGVFKEIVAIQPI